MIDVKGLVGIPYCDAERMRDPLVACDCWALGRMVLAAVRVELPADPAELLSMPAAIGETVWVETSPREGKRAQAGDLVVLKGDLGVHLGVMIDEFRLIHQTKHGSRVDSLVTCERAGVVKRRVRPHELPDEFGRPA